LIANKTIKNIAHFRFLDETDPEACVEEEEERSAAGIAGAFLRRTLAVGFSGAGKMAAPAGPPQYPPLTHEQAKEALDKSIQIFQVPENKEKLEKIIGETSAIEDPMQRQMAMMGGLLPIVQEMLASVMKEYGYEGQQAVMPGVMQIQMHAMKDPDMQEKVGKLMGALQGKIPGAS